MEKELEPIENIYTHEELKKEFRYYCDLSYQLLYALRDLPEFPSPFILKHLSTSAKFPKDWDKGKQLQNKYGSETIPYKTECELGAGLWFRLRESLLNVQSK